MSSLLLTYRLFNPISTTMVEGRQVEQIEAGGRLFLCGTDISINTGGALWDAAFVLVKYLEKHRDRLVAGKRIVEVGAGTGIVGIACWSLGANSVMLTDLEILQDLLSFNVKINTVGEQHGTLSSAVVDWTRISDAKSLVAEFGESDLIVASDVLWLEELVEPFLETLAVVAADNSMVLLAYQERSAKMTSIFFERARRDFEVKKIAEKDLHPDFVSPAIAIYEMRKKRCDE